MSDELRKRFGWKAKDVEVTPPPKPSEQPKEKS